MLNKFFKNIFLRHKELNICISIIDIINCIQNYKNDKKSQIVNSYGDPSLIAAIFNIESPQKRKYCVSKQTYHGLKIVMPHKKNIDFRRGLP